MNKYYELKSISDPPKEGTWCWCKYATDDTLYWLQYRGSVWKDSYGHMLDVAEYLSPVPALGPVWVKASEVLPSIFDSHERHYRVDGKKVDGGRFYKDVNGDFVFQYRHHSGFITNANLSEVEWLDESPPLSCSRIGEQERGGALSHTNKRRSGYSR